MKHIKTCCSLLLIAALVMLAACAPAAPSAPSESAAPTAAAPAESAAPDEAASADKTFKVGFAAVWAGNTWGVQALYEVEHALQSNPLISEYYITNAENNAAKQASDIEDMLTKGIDCLVLQPVNAEALTEVIEKAYDKGVIIVTTASKLATEKYHASVCSDEQEFGRVGAQWLVDTLGGKGNVIILDGMSGIATAENRLAGAMSVLDKYPDIKVVGKEFADWDYAKGKIATENMLAANPQIDGVWSSGGDMTRGAIEAFVAAKRPLIPMTGEDGNGFLKLWKQYKEDPGFQSIATTMPAWIYAEGVETGIKILTGQPFEKDVVIPVPTITKDTLDQFVREDLNDSFWANTRLSEDLIKQYYGN